MSTLCDWFNLRNSFYVMFYVYCCHYLSSEDIWITLKCEDLLMSNYRPHYMS